MGEKRYALLPARRVLTYKKNPRHEGAAQDSFRKEGDGSRPGVKLPASQGGRAAGRGLSNNKIETAIEGAVTASGKKNAHSRWEKHTESS